MYILAMSHESSFSGKPTEIICANRNITIIEVEDLF